MYECDYCGRKLKNHYEVCPGCGSNKFTQKAYMGEIVIKTPPEGGYTIQMDLDDQKLPGNFLKYCGIIVIILCTIMFLPQLISIITDLAVKTDKANEILNDFASKMATFGASLIVPILLLVWGNNLNKNVSVKFKRRDKHKIK